MFIKTLIIIKKLIVLFFLSSFSIVAIYRIFPPPVTPFMIYRSINGFIDWEFVGMEKEWTDYKDLSPQVLRTFVAAEDARYMSHNGIDWKAVEEAIEYNKKHKGNKIRGASTITMQTSKNAFLLPYKNYIRKAFEVYFSYLIESYWGKKRILEIYASIIELGKGIYGVEAASQYYFGRSSKKLTRRQSALLAAVLPNPRRWSPAKPTRYISRRAYTIQKRARYAPIPKK